MNLEVTQLLRESPIWVLKIDRPQALNALNLKVLAEISEVLTMIENSKSGECQGLVLTGGGEKAFVAGADIKEIAAMDEPKKAQEFASLGQKLFSRFESLPIPVVAAVNGFALGGGFELALACDYIYASNKAKFGLPEVSLGLIPGFGGTVRLTHAVGPWRAREMILSGEMISAEQAFEMGFVSALFAPEDLLPQVMERLTKQMAKTSLFALSAAKKSVLFAAENKTEVAFDREAHLFGELFAGPDVAEGTLAFTEKRKADFVSRK